MRIAPLAVLIASFSLAGCGDDAGKDSGVVDTGMPDGGEVDLGDVDSGDADVDLGFDAGPMLPGLCGPCRRDSDCGDGNLCLAFTGGERACGMPCATPGDCPGGYECVARRAGDPLQCSPTAHTCVISPPGMTCASDADCMGRYALCRDPIDTGKVCTAACTDDADCTIGLSRCRAIGSEKLCIPDAVPSGQRCTQLIADMHATACGAGGTCAGGMRCVGTGATKVCAAPFASSCPTGTHRFTPADGSGDVCMPVTTDPDDWSDLGGDCMCAGSIDATSLYGRALATISRDECTQGFPQDIVDLFGTNVSHDPYRLSFTDRIRGHWPAAVRFAEANAAGLDTEDPSVALATLARDADLPLAPPRSPTTMSAQEALAALITAAGSATPPDAATISADLSTLDPSLVTALADVFAALTDALAARSAALARVPSDEWPGLVDGPSSQFLASVGLAIDPHLSSYQGALRGDVDVARMASASRDLLVAIRAANLSRFAGSAGGGFHYDTDAGRIAIGGSGADTYDDPDFHATLFLLELGGDDTYHVPAGATTDATHGLSVVVDLAGTDTYGYVVHAVAGDTTPVGSGGARLPSDGAGRGIVMDPAHPSVPYPASLSAVSRQGVGRLGIGMLVDLGTTGDHYRSLRMSQAYAALGVGVLWDAAGDDTYEGEAAVQGAATSGIALLFDAAGADHYTAYTESQGFAYVKGVGAIDDQAGDDVYYAPPNDVLYFSPQDPGNSNSSFSQGAGFGRRDDTPGGPSMSGGLGVLRDRAGNDAYTCGIFGQGTGYLFGTGMLLDGGGADTYDAQWYVQGAAAHYAVGIEIDDGPERDVHNMSARRQNMTLGAGHDFSLGLFLDRGGDDEYHAPNLAIGGGNAAGTGIFGDASGADLYECTSDLSMGNASVESPGDSAREMAHTLGIFLDADGTDTYTRPSVTVTPADDSTWTQNTNGTTHGELGVGVDDHAAHLGL